LGDGLSKTILVEAMGLCSNPSLNPAFDRLLKVLKAEPFDIESPTSKLTWEKD
jgi:hypothetical protein